jgi:DNA polymerase III delta prime subunit
MSTNMHAFLVTSQDKNIRETKAQELAFERGIQEIISLHPEKQKHYIASIRALLRQLMIAPLNPEQGRAVIIYDANLLTQDAANSFLKTLEEPVGNTIIILTAPDHELVLDTIASRTQHIDIPSIFTSEGGSIDDFIDKSLGGRFKKLDKIKDREQAAEFCNKLIMVLRTELVSGKNNSQNIIQQIESVIQTKKDIESNVNIKIALGDLFLRFN